MSRAVIVSGASSRRRSEQHPAFRSKTLLPENLAMRWARKIDQKISEGLQIVSRERSLEHRPCGRQDQDSVAKTGL